MSKFLSLGLNWTSTGVNQHTVLYTLDNAQGVTIPGFHLRLTALKDLIDQAVTIQLEYPQAVLTSAALLRSQGRLGKKGAVFAAGMMQSESLTFQKAAAEISHRTMLAQPSDDAAHITLPISYVGGRRLSPDPVYISRLH